MKTIKVKFKDSIIDICIAKEIYDAIYNEGKADGIDDALFVLYDKGYIDSDTEEYVIEKLKEQK